MAAKVDKKVQEQLQRELEGFKKIQRDLQKLATGRQQLDAQLNENNIVKEELTFLDDSSNIYKLIGPVLVKQDLGEAKLNVEKRIEYIKGEIDRHDKTLRELESKQNSSKEALTILQQQYQQQMVKAQSKP